jgi:16S rRNA (uracil1498-N3)-methyltransferase
MHRFFVEPDQIKENSVIFPAEISHQILRVLRLKIDSEVKVLDNQGLQYLVKLVKLDPSQCEGEIIQSQDIDTEPKTRLHLLVALTQREKFEWILQKCCEMGVHKITPMVTERSLVLSTGDFNKKQDRWNRIIKEAAEQSQRGLIPYLSLPIFFNQAIRDQSSWRLIAWENEAKDRLIDVFDGKSVEEVAVMIGPEGGFSQQEIQSASTNGWLPFSMGKRILRMETAAIVACSLVFHLTGDI